MPNRLAQETSPYLLQHANNPVDWYPWGEEALQKAKAEDRPIFLSIGYSACHWCHVMEHESFEDPRVADALNRSFVSIKVDREERPDLDQIYMTAVQALTGGGGWPMSVFLTPEGQPFYGGTYFPPARRGGMPAFTEVLQAVATAWQNRRQEVLEGGKRVAEAIHQQNAPAPAGDGEALQAETLASALQGLQGQFDKTHGGWGSAPKFPQPMVLEFILRHHRSTGDPQALDMAARTLQSMARGGLYDQLGGGFHRYSVDERWLVPHFEKMLYDNAQLARLYLHGWQVAGLPLYRAVVEETLDYVLREMTDPAGGFYSTQDADSEGEEGLFYLWTAEEVRGRLGDRAEAFVAAYGVTDRGNFEGKNILTFVGREQERTALVEARRQLLAAREQRVRPGRDEKVLTSWNGLMLAAFAEAGRVLKRDDYRRAAERNADFLLREMCRPDRRLRHTWKGGTARIEGYLEDYANVIEGLLALYQATFAPRWYLAARELAETMIAHFSAPAGFFDTSDDHRTPVTRPRDLQDNAVPSGNSVAATALLRLGGLAVEPRYADLAQRSLGQVHPLLTRYPLGFGQWLVALEYALSHPREIAIIGSPEAPDTRTLVETCMAGFQPHRIVVVGGPDGDTPEIPLLAGRGQVDGHATAYVCFDYTCQPPVTDPRELAALLP